MISSVKSCYSIIFTCFFILCLPTTVMADSLGGKEQERSLWLGRASGGTPHYTGGDGGFSQKRVQRREELRRDVSKKPLKSEPAGEGEESEEGRLTLGQGQILPKSIIFRSQSQIRTNQLTQIVFGYIERPMRQKELDALCQEIQTYFANKNISVKVFAVKWIAQRQELVLAVQMLTETKKEPSSRRKLSG